MKNSFDGLAIINIELTSLCNKSCWMCGRGRIEKEYPELVTEDGHMDLNLLKNIAAQLPSNIVV